MTRVSGEPALVLHVRPYRESSAIVSLLTPSHGRVPVVARGVRGGKRGNILQPFNLVRASWSGRGSLVTLTGSELTRHGWLSGNALASGFYVLELVTRLVHEHESAPEIFQSTCWALEHLESAAVPADVVLRAFEKRLLEELGYGLDFTTEGETGEPIRSDLRYEMHPGSGFFAVGEGRGYPGALLLEIDAGTYHDRATRLAARKIFRRALEPLLGDRPLVSRRLLRRTRV